MRKLVASGLIAATCVISVSACSSSSNGPANTPPTTAAPAQPPLSAAAYKQALKDVAAQENRAQHAVQKAFHASTAAAVRHVLTAFAADQQRVSAELRATKPPADARSANAALAKAFADNAAATRAVVRQMSRATTAKAALHIIQTASGPQRSGHEIDTALARLRKLGYTAGS